MDDKSIVFYCKNCGQMFFATTSKMVKDDPSARKSINKYLAAGHVMRMVDHDTVRAEFSGCQCD